MRPINQADPDRVAQKIIEAGYPGDLTREKTGDQAIQQDILHMEASVALLKHRMLFMRNEETVARAENTINELAASIEQKRAELRYKREARGCE